MQTARNVLTGKSLPTGNSQSAFFPKRLFHTWLLTNCNIPTRLVSLLTFVAPPPEDNAFLNTVRSRILLPTSSPLRIRDCSRLVMEEERFWWYCTISEYRNAKADVDTGGSFFEGGMDRGEWEEEALGEDSIGAPCARVGGMYVRARACVWSWRRSRGSLACVERGVRGLAKVK